VAVEVLAAVLATATVKAMAGEMEMAVAAWVPATALVAQAPVMATALVAATVPATPDQRVVSVSPVPAAVFITRLKQQRLPVIFLPSADYPAVPALFTSPARPKPAKHPAPAQQKPAAAADPVPAHGISSAAAARALPSRPMPLAFG
jgi:hypothetical protein